ncbi:MAG: phage tail protein [Sphingobacteriaceae bacterium]|nr:MAG: phage tail protein [Sphingobacteriaceae bacterium]
MEPYVGEIRMFAGTFAPKGWLLCDGSYYDSHTYATLYSLIMEIYGGDGGNKFAVPDLRGRAPIQWGQGIGLSGYSIGQHAGAEKVTLTVPQLPPHNHQVNVNADLGSVFNPSNTSFLSASNIAADTKEVNTYSAAKGSATLHTETISQTGGGQSVSILSPVLAVTYIIAWEGIYPSRP